VEFKLAVELNGDLEFDDREFGNRGRGAAAKTWAFRGIRGRSSSDAFVLFDVRYYPTAHSFPSYLERASGQSITLGATAERAVTCPALEAEVTIGGERSKVERAPVETSRLLTVTLIVCVGGTRECGGIGKSLDMISMRMPHLDRVTYSRCKLNSGRQSSNG